MSVFWIICFLVSFSFNAINDDSKDKEIRKIYWEKILIFLVGNNPFIKLSRKPLISGYQQMHTEVNFLWIAETLIQRIERGEEVTRNVYFITFIYLYSLEKTSQKSELQNCSMMKMLQYVQKNVFNHFTSSRSFTKLICLDIGGGNQSINIDQTSATSSFK